VPSTPGHGEAGPGGLFFCFFFLAGQRGFSGPTSGGATPPPPFFPLFLFPLLFEDHAAPFRFFFPFRLGPGSATHGRYPFFFPLSLFFLPLLSVNSGSKRKLGGVSSFFSPPENGGPGQPGNRLPLSLSLFSLFPPSCHLSRRIYARTHPPFP